MSRLSACVKILLLSALLALGAIPFGGSALATEGGGSAYPNGAEDFMAGALPPPGTYFINYFNYYRATSFKDRNGNNAMPKFDLNVYTDVLRFVHVTQKKIFGADWAVHAFVPLQYTDVDASTGKDNRSAWAISSSTRSSWGGISRISILRRGWISLSRPEVMTGTGSQIPAAITGPSSRFWG